MLIKKIVKRGDSHYILISKDIMDLLNLNLNDEIEIKVDKDSIIIIPIKK